MPDQLTVSALHEAARQHAREGRKVFPCWPGTKMPATPNGFRDATSDLAVIDAWWIENPDFNLAYCPGDHDECVVDIDGAPGETSWEYLMLCEPCPDTREARTPRGGRHLTFKGQLPPTAWRTNSKRCLGECIDTRGAGSYVLLPPSRTEDGEYRWLNDLALAPVPEWMVEKTKRRETRTSAPDDLELNLPGNVQRARSHAKYVAAPAEGSRNNEAFQLTCELRDLGVTPPVAFDILAKEWNPRCDPPLELGELAQTVESAGRNAQNAPGVWASRSASETFASAVEAIAAAGTGGSPVPFSTLLARPVPPLVDIIPGLLEKGITTLLSAPGGMHKSRMAIQWGASIAAGAPIFGRTVERAAFVYLSYEDSEAEVTRRVHKITERLNLTGASGNAQYWNLRDRAASSPLAIVRDTEIELQPFYTELTKYLLSVPGHKFVVADSCYDVMPFVGAAKVNEAMVKASISMLDRLCRETDSTILLLWHPSQAGQERGDASGWSVAWHNAPRARLSLTGHPNNESAYDLKVEKRNYGPKGKPLTLHWSDGVLLPLSGVDSAQQASLLLEACIRVALLAAEQGAPIQRQRHLQGWQLSDIERDAGFKPTQGEVKEELARAMRLGRLRYMRGHGKQQAGYFPVESFDALKLAALASETG